MIIFDTENIINCRDLSGYISKCGTTAPCKAIRCGIPKDPTAKDIATLKHYNIKNIIDLRGDKEAEERPSYFLKDNNFNYYHISTLEANPALCQSDITTCQLYAMSLENFGDNYNKLIKTILDIDGSFLYHCFLGKDRTGILSLLMLEAIGVSREDIVKDYSMSWQFIEPFITLEKKNKSALIWEQDISRLRSDASFILETFDYLDTKFNGPVGYLKYVGITDNQIENLAKKLV